MKLNVTHRLGNYPVVHVDYSEEIANGADLLDRVAPGWEHDIDLSNLDVASGRRCVLGQMSLSQLFPKNIQRMVKDQSYGFGALVDTLDKTERDYLRSKFQGDSNAWVERCGFVVDSTFRHLTETEDFKLENGFVISKNSRAAWGWTDYYPHSGPLYDEITVQWAAFIKARLKASDKRWDLTGLRDTPAPEDVVTETIAQPQPSFLRRVLSLR